MALTKEQIKRGTKFYSRYQVRRKIKTQWEIITDPYNREIWRGNEVRSVQAINNRGKVQIFSVSHLINWSSYVEGELIHGNDSPPVGDQNVASVSPTVEIPICTGSGEEVASDALLLRKPGSPSGGVED